MANQIQLRYDSSSNWATSNPIPLVAEVCVDTTLGMMKVGDGVNHFADLPWLPMNLNDPALATKITTVGAGAFVAIARAADIDSLLTRVATIEESGILKTGLTPFTLTSNANVFTTLGTGAGQAGQYTVPANTFAAGDTLIFTGIADLLNNSGGSVVFDLQFIVGAFRLTGTPATAGYSVATGAARRPLHIWVEVTFVDATHVHIASGFQLAAPKAANDEIALFNGTTTGFGSQDTVANAAINAAANQTFAIQGKIRTNSALTELKLIRPMWIYAKGAP